MLNKLSKENLAYMIGLLQGDGHLSEDSRNRGKLRYEISVKDADIVEKLEWLLQSYVHTKISTRTRATNFSPSSTTVTLNVYDLMFRQQLAQYVPVGKKSATITPFTKLSASHYIRGLTDADGSIGLTAEYRCFWSLCTSSDAVAQYLFQAIEKVVGVKKQVKRNKRDNVYNIILFDEDAQTFLSYIYTDAKLYIERKYDAYLKVMKWTRPKGRKPKIRRQIFSKEEDKIILDPSLPIGDKQQLLKRTRSSIETRLWRLKKQR